MIAVLFRVVLLTAGLGVTEMSLVSALGSGSPAGWVLLLIVGLPLIVAGSAGFIGPLLGRIDQEGGEDHA